MIKIVQLIPADGWEAEVGTGGEKRMLNLVCWSLIESPDEKTGILRQAIIGLCLVNGLVVFCDQLPGFVRYVKE